MSQPTILIVEDDDWIATEQQKILEAAGYVVHIAPHALSAIVKVDEVHPQALILDLLLTGTTGFALMHELQSYSDTDTLPIIICSNAADDLVMDELAPYGVKRILDKATMHPDDLVAAVRSVLT